MSKLNKARFGIFYKSRGKWVGPYAGTTFTKYTVSRNPVKEDIRLLRSILKSKIEVRRVK